MAKKKKKAMTDNQFTKAMDELNSQLPKFRGGRAERVIPNKKKQADRRACRGKIHE